MLNGGHTTLNFLDCSPLHVVQLKPKENELITISVNMFDIQLK